MTTADVKALDGKTVGSIELPDAWFAGEINIPAMHQVVNAQLAAARQGTHKTKTRSEVRGTTKKPFRQKGTGNARQGSLIGPHQRGGGVAHGRTPSNWAQRVNKKLKKLALRSALTDRAQSEAVIVVRDLAFDAPKTKDAVAALGALEAGDGRTLVVLADVDMPTIKSFRNLQNVNTISVDQLNTHDVLVSDRLVIDEKAIDLIGTGKRASTADDNAKADA